VILILYFRTDLYVVKLKHVVNVALIVVLLQVLQELNAEFAYGLQGELTVYFWKKVGQGYVDLVVPEGLKY